MADSVQAYLKSLEEEYERPVLVRNMMPRPPQSMALAVTVGLAAGQANPVNAGPINFTVTFSRPVVGFVNADISFVGSTVGGTLAAAVTGTGPAYNVAVTGMTGSGLVAASVIPAAATDAVTGAPTPGSIAANVMFDTTAPSVTIQQAAGQTDPSSTTPVNFSVVFSKAVMGFTSADINFTGSTVGGTLVATVTGSGASYNAAVTGMSGNGLVTINVPAGAATDLAGNLSLAAALTFGTVAFASAGTYLAYGTHINSVLAAPAGVSDGEFLVAYLMLGLASSNPSTPTLPSGWSEMVGSPVSDSFGGFFCQYHVYYKTAASEPSNYTFTHASAQSCGVVFRYTGVDTTAPFSPVPTNAIGSGSTATATGFTTTVPNTFVIFTEQDFGDNTTDTVPPTGTTPTFTERVDQTLLYIADGTLASAGATGNKSHTCNSVGGSNWAAYLIGLKPTAVGAFDNTVTFNDAAVAGDGTAGAPSGAANFPTILNGYVARPPWNVSGVDYRCGINTGVTLKNPAVDALPPNCTRDIPATIFYVNGNTVVDGWNFTGWQCIVMGGTAPTVRNCRFAAGYLTWSGDGTAVGGTIEFCEFDDLGVDNSVTLFRIFNAGDFLIRYNVFLNSFYQHVQLTNGVARYTVKYNCFASAGLGASAGAHGDWIQLFGSNVIPNTIIDYNLFYQNNAPAATQGVSLNALTPELHTGSVSNNTMICKTNVNAMIIMLQQWTQGPFVVNTNYCDPTFPGVLFLATNDAFGPGPFPGTGHITATGNINMLTGGSIS